MGTPTGLLLFDLDFYLAGCPVKDRDDVIRRYGPIPDTAEVTNGGDSRHIYFRHGGTPMPKQLAPAVQLKGDGGYAVAPPSIHPITGREYVFDGMAGASALLNVADAPDWLLTAIADASKPRPMAEPQAVVGVHIADDDLIIRARKASRKFLRLWDGHWEGEYPSQSEADLALCRLLAYWANRDPSRIDALFRRSSLMRKKWDRADYRTRTIRVVLETK
jgi:hypothetical protein